MTEPQRNKRGFPQQKLNTYWAEHGMIIHSDFRDGNVPAGYKQKSALDESTKRLPAEVKKVYVRSDTAGYQWELLEYMAKGENERFGVIEFAVGANVTKEFRKAVSEVKEEDWHPIRVKIKGEWKETGQEWAEVCYVPNRAGYSKKNPDYRYIAAREPIKQLELSGIEKVQKELPRPDENSVQKGCCQLPFPTMDFGEKGSYKIYGIVTNRDTDGEVLIKWYRKRCGKSEEVHAIMKEDLAGGKLPSGKFGSNAAWWQIMILALNINEALKRLVLDKEWENKRMKAIRYHIINVAGQVLSLARGLIVKISCAHSSFKTLISAQQKIKMLAAVPGG